MIITKYQITFTRLHQEDIELVRHWRNAPQINQYMVFRGNITEEMQQKWFDSINNNNNLYFIVEYKGKKIGLINGKDIDWEKNTMETGVFFWGKDDYNTPIPLMGSLAFGELGIVIAHLNAYARIFKSNSRSIRFNKMIGFELCEGQENEENQLYILTRESFLKRGFKIRKALNMLAKDHNLKLILEKEDFDSGMAELILERIDKSMIKEVTEDERGVVYGF